MLLKLLKRILAISYFYPFRRFCAWFLSKTSLTAKAKIDCDLTLYVDLASSVGRSIWLRGYYEPQIHKLIQSILKEGDIFFDVGANVGYFSVIASPIVGHSGKVFAFEPNPIVAQLLFQSIKKQPFSNIELIKKAVTSDGSDVLLKVLKNSGFSYTLPKRISAEKSSLVPSVALDDFKVLKCGNNCPRLIKVDVEGAEMDVLRGAERTLRYCDTQVLMEIQNWTLQRYGHTVQDVFTYMKELGYKALNCDFKVIKESDVSRDLYMVLFRKEH